MIKLTQLAGVFCLGLLLASCASRSPVLPFAAAPDPKAAILYGRFAFSQKPDSQIKLALWLQTTDKHRNVYLYFDPQQPVVAVPVQAGRYQIVGYVGTDWTGEVMGRRKFGSPEQPRAVISLAFTAGAGSEIYLGDYTGAATYNGTVYNWVIGSCTNHFAGTTAELQDKYPQLRGTPVTLQALQLQ